MSVNFRLLGMVELGLKNSHDKLMYHLIIAY